MLRARKCSELAATDKSFLLSASASASEEIRGSARVQASRVNSDGRTEGLPPTRTCSGWPGCQGTEGCHSGPSPLRWWETGPGQGVTCPGPVSGSGYCWGPRGRVWGPVISNVRCGVQPSSAERRQPYHCRGRQRAASLWLSFWERSVGDQTGCTCQGAWLHPGTAPGPHSDQWAFSRDFNCEHWFGFCSFWTHPQGPELSWKPFIYNPRAPACMPLPGR